MNDKDEDRIFQLNLVIAYLIGMSEKSEYVHAKEYADRLIEISDYLLEQKGDL